MSGRRIVFAGKSPQVHGRAWVAPDATLIGDVVLGEDSSVWFGCVVRGDVSAIRIGARTNVQDLTTIHGTTGLSSTTLGDEVTVGHRAVLHGCTIGDRVLVGMGSIVLDNAVLESDLLLAAGSLVTPRTVLPSGYLCAGSPAKPLRPLKDHERAMIEQGHLAYVGLIGQYLADG